MKAFRFFDSHLHIIDDRFALVENQGYLPPVFRAETYLQTVQGLNVVGGAVVSGSFQAFDQDYLLAALHTLGPTFVGVTQLPPEVTDDKIFELDRAGVRAVRFNIKRGGSAGVDSLESFARRVHELVGWHAELYIDSSDLEPLSKTLASLPKVSIDHLGLSRRGFPTLLRLVEKGVYVKATGFGRVDLDVKEAMRDLWRANPDALVFGTDLPGTRAPRAFEPRDLELVVEALGEAAAARVFLENATALYRPRTRP